MARRRQESPPMSRYEMNDSMMNFKKNIEMLRSFFFITLNIKNDVFEMHHLVQFATRK